MKMSDMIEKCRELAKQYPEAWYERPEGGRRSCLYTGGRVIVDGEKVCDGCILGNAILLADPEFYSEKLSDEPHTGFGEFTEVAFDWELVDIDGRHAVPTTRSEMELDWLQCVQDRQDNGVKWGEAVAYADRECSLG